MFIYFLFKKKNFFFVLEAEGKIEEDKRALFLTYTKICRAKYLANNISTKRGPVLGVLLLLLRSIP